MLKKYVILFLLKGIEICGRSAEVGDVDHNGTQDLRAYDIILAGINYDDEGNYILYAEPELTLVVQKANVATGVELSEAKVLELLSSFANREDFLNLSDVKLPEAEAQA